MTVSDELREKVERIFPNDSKIKLKLLSGDPEAIRSIGIIAGKGINPEDVVNAFENNSTQELLKKAMDLMALKEIYDELCQYYYEKTKKGSELEF